jgi:hypothetical protein
MPKPKPYSRVTKDEDKYLRKAYAEHRDVQEIAGHLCRSYGVIRQRVLYLGLKREHSKTSLANRYGREQLEKLFGPSWYKKVSPHLRRNCKI